MTKDSGTILWGANNIFYVQAKSDKASVECRFLGKKLAKVENEYNALVPGDEVEIERNGSSGMIFARTERKNAMLRWNKKEGRPQAFAANLDQIWIVSSPDSPPFRPRFIDRLLLAADVAQIEPIIILNKIDQGMNAEVEDRLAGFQEMDYEVLLASAETGEGVDEIRDLARGKRVVVCGQSGVGKSTLLNGLLGLSLKTGEVSQKFNRGRHTTVLSKMFELEGGGQIIDTPGVREFEPCKVDPQALAFLFRDIKPLAQDCSLRNCTHQTEPDCKVRDAAQAGDLDPDRYESYLRIYQALIEQEAL